MRDVAELVRSLGGMAQKQQLVRRGARDIDLTYAVRSGDVLRARQGWYTTMSESSLEVRAVRVGGRLTGISALQSFGAWVLGEHPLHVSVHDNAARLRTQWNRRVRFDSHRPRGVELHWDDFEVRERGSATTVALADALVRVILDEDLETAVAAIDWALRTGAIDSIEWEKILLQLPANRRAIGDWVDDRCDSLPESLSRTRLRFRGHSIVSQVPLGELESIDLLVDDCVANEIDGERYHIARFEKDRRKDCRIAIENFHGFRSSAVMVFDDWDFTVRGIEAALQTHGVVAPFGNSGSWARHRSKIPILPGSRMRRPLRSPEFPDRR